VHEVIHIQTGTEVTTITAEPVQLQVKYCVYQRAYFCVLKKGYILCLCASEVYGQYLRHMQATMACCYSLRLDPFLTQLDYFQHTLRVRATVLHNNLVSVEHEYYYLSCIMLYCYT